MSLRPNKALHRSRRRRCASAEIGEHRASGDGRRGAPVMAQPLGRLIGCRSNRLHTSSPARSLRERKDCEED
jgi:hypothetical protein